MSDAGCIPGREPRSVAASNINNDTRFRQVVDFCRIFSEPVPSSTHPSSQTKRQINRLILELCAVVVFVSSIEFRLQLEIDIHATNKTL